MNSVNSLNNNIFIKTIRIEQIKTTFLDCWIRLLSSGGTDANDLINKSIGNNKQHAKKHLAINLELNLPNDKKDLIIFIIILLKRFN